MRSGGCKERKQEEGTGMDTGTGRSVGIGLSVLWYRVIVQRKTSSGCSKQQLRKSEIPTMLGRTVQGQVKLSLFPQLHRLLIVVIFHLDFAPFKTTQ